MVVVVEPLAWDMLVECKAFALVPALASALAFA